MIVRKKVIQFFVVLLLFGVLLGAVQFSHFGGLTGFVVFGGLSEEIPLIAGAELRDDLLIIDYYPGDYVGEREDLLVRYEVVDRGGTVIYDGFEEISLNVDPKHRFLLDIDVSDSLPENFGIKVFFVESEDGEIIEEESLDSSFVRKESNLG